MQNDFSTRLKYFRSLRDLSQVELAKRVGISSKQVSDYEVGSSKPRQSTYMKILNALDVSDQVFSNSDLCSLELDDLDRDKNQVITFSNTSGDQILLSTSYCVKNNLLPAADLSVFPVKGNSMYPTLSDGDLVLIDNTDKDFLSGLIYLVFFYGEKTIVRLHRSQLGLVDLCKDNPSFPDRTGIGDSEFIVLGKVVYRQGLI